MLLKVKNIYKTYFSETFLGRHSGQVNALSGVNFSVEKGGIIGIVGESGSGKSTLGRIICGLVEPTRGQVIWTPEKVKDSRVQMIFQNTAGSLNPKLKISYILREAVASVKRVRPGFIKEEKIRKILSKVGLEKINIQNFPYQFSGGQQQRIVIARALALKPELLVCDEPVSALDISIQAQVLNLIKKINKNEGLTIVFIAHDIEVVNIISHNIFVMNKGRIVEKGSARQVISNPQKDYTKKLIGAVPVNPYFK